MKGSAVRVRASAPYETPAKPRVSAGLCLVAKAHEPRGGNAGGNKHGREPPPATSRVVTRSRSYEARPSESSGMTDLAHLSAALHGRIKSRVVAVPHALVEEIFRVGPYVLG